MSLLSFNILCSRSLSRTGYSEVIPRIFERVKTQVLKLKVRTNVLSVEKDGKIVVTTKAARGGKQDMVRSPQICLASKGTIGNP